jgi:hypothetical protein
MANKKIRSRFYMIMQYEKNPRTGENLNFNEQAILKGLQEREESLNAWAYVCHDKDVYNQDDDIPEGKKIGDKRPKHWHVMLHFKNAVEIASLARSFGVAENYVEKWTGAGAFLDGIQYLTHEHPRQQELGKHRYDRDEVKFASEKIAEFYWDALDTRTERNVYKLPKAELVEQMQKKISEGKMSLRDAYLENATLYNENEPLFKRARRNYLQNKDLPLVRSNYYITGDGGAGKSVAAKAMARSMYPNMRDEEIFFVVGDGKVAFDRYDGQPVIIWDDWRADDLLAKFDRGTVWKIFAVHPEKVTQSVKYGEVVLTNAVNIVTAVQPFNDFIKGLAGEYVDSRRVKHKKEDPGQGYRRFPLFIEVNQDSLDIYVSMALTSGEKDDYRSVATIEASMLDLAKNLSQKNIDKVMEPVQRLHKTIEHKHGSNRKDVTNDVSVKITYNDEFEQLNLLDDDD